MRFWRAIRWPLLIALVVFALVYFLVGLIQSVGFFGTTSLRSVSQNESTWRDFEGLFESRKGAPFSWQDGKKPPVDYGIVKFDKRLIRALSYLSKSKPTSCGWNGQHEDLQLSINAPEVSDLSYSFDNLPSSSTVSRGVGVRIASADKIKCTLKPNSDKCPTKVPLQSEEFDEQAIPLVAGKNLEIKKPYDRLNCEVICAVDYYPDPLSPTGTLNGSAKPTLQSDVGNLNPGEFPYEQIVSAGKKAGVYKTAQLIYELMTIDDPGCETRDGNKGNERAIPNAIIAPKWVTDKMSDFWNELTGGFASSKFPYRFQEKSPLYGLTNDYKLDNKGLHFNY